MKDKIKAWWKKFIHIHDWVEIHRDGPGVVVECTKCKKTEIYSLIPRL